MEQKYIIAHINILTKRGRDPLCKLDTYILMLYIRIWEMQLLLLKQVHNFRSIALYLKGGQFGLVV